MTDVILIKLLMTEEEKKNTRQIIQRYTNQN